jgi:hypothetical protein
LRRGGTKGGIKTGSNEAQMRLKRPKFANLPNVQAIVQAIFINCIELPPLVCGVEKQWTGSDWVEGQKINAGSEGSAYD